LTKQREMAGKEERREEQVGGTAGEFARGR
jgi:hypothetical protein